MNVQKLWRPDSILGALSIMLGAGVIVEGEPLGLASGILLLIAGASLLALDKLSKY